MKRSGSQTRVGTSTGKLTLIPLECMKLEHVSDGNSRLVLTETMNWDYFPAYARLLTRFLVGSIVSKAAGLDAIICGVSFGDIKVNLVYEVYPEHLVAFEALDQAGSDFLSELAPKLSSTVSQKLATMSATDKIRHAIHYHAHRYMFVVWGAAILATVLTVALVMRAINS